MHLAAASAAAECLWTELQPGQAPNCPVGDSGPGSTPAAGVSGPRACPAGSPAQCQAWKKVSDKSLKTGMQFKLLRPKEYAVELSSLKNKIKIVGWLAAP